MALKYFSAFFDNPYFLKAWWMMIEFSGASLNYDPLGWPTYFGIESGGSKCYVDPLGCPTYFGIESVGSKCFDWGLIWH